MLEIVFFFHSFWSVTAFIRRQCVSVCVVFLRVVLVVFGYAQVES